MSVIQIKFKVQENGSCQKKFRVSVLQNDNMIEIPDINFKIKSASGGFLTSKIKICNDFCGKKFKVANNDGYLIPFNWVTTSTFIS